MSLNGGSELVLSEETSSKPKQTSADLLHVYNDLQQSGVDSPLAMADGQTQNIVP